VNYTKITIRVTVMNEVQFLLAPEPCEPLKPRSLYVIFLVEKDVRVERRRRGHAWKRFHTQARHVALHGSNAIRDMRAYAVTAYVL